MRKEDVLKMPLVSERMTTLTEKQNVYGFIVDRRANKLEIKKAVEDMYNVNVESVRTMVIPGKKKLRYTTTGVLSGQSKAYKKALVKLKSGEKIDFFTAV